MCIKGGFWELPGGKREKGETDRQALERELQEELGVELLSARPFVKWNHDYGDRYLSFIVIAVGCLIPMLLPHEQVMSCNG